MRAESPQKGNPHRLTVKQHTFPKRSIERFLMNGGVETIEPFSGRRLRRPPTDPLFCAIRAWDHKTEHMLLASIDLAFQRIAESILAGSRELTAQEHDSISEFYSSWLVRHEFRKLPWRTHTRQPTGLPRTADDDDLAERLERDGVIYWRRDGSVGTHILNGPALLVHIGAQQDRMDGTRWGIVTAQPGDGEFLVPDTFSRFPIVPLSPTVCLIAGFDTHTALFSAIADINGLAVANADRYYFARSLANCPIRKSTVIYHAVRRALRLEDVPHS